MTSTKNYTVKSLQRHLNHQVLTITPQAEADVLRYWPGQYATIGFKLGGRLSPMRCFSIISTPGSNDLRFAMRTRGPFTSQVALLEPGDEIRMQGPFGNFVLDPSDKNIVMLAAGIGITPFVSLLHYLATSGSQVPVTLLYACRSVSDIPFADELRALQRNNPRLHVTFMVDSGESNPAQNIYSGRIDDALLQRVTGQRFQGVSYFICGPGGFMDTMNAILAAHNVDSEHIITESFTQKTTLGWNLSRLSIPSATYAMTSMALLGAFGLLMVGDLVRFLPKVSAQSKTTLTPAANVSSGDDQASSSSANNNATSQYTTTPSSNQTTQTYQAPVSTVS